MVWYEAKMQEKITIGTEWGGGGMCHPSDYESMFDGVKNSLRALEVLQDGLPVCKRGAQLIPTTLNHLQYRQACSWAIVF